MVLNKLCPICNNRVQFIEGCQTASSGYYLPSVKCECGFHYKPNMRLCVRWHESTYEAEARLIGEAEELIKNLFQGETIDVEESL